MRWSIGLEAEGDRIMVLEEIVELADAVAVYSGMATGIGTEHYGAQLLVEADGRDQAVKLATECFRRCAAQAGLPEWPIGRIVAMSEDDEDDEEIIP